MEGNDPDTGNGLNVLSKLEEGEERERVSEG